MHYIDHIESMDACDDALAWLRNEDHPDITAAWAACPRADWMLWLAGRCAASDGSKHAAIVAAAADCAAAVLDLIPAGEGRPRAAVETARRWCTGQATAAECWAAADAANAAAAVHAASTAAAAAARAAFAANASHAATYAAAGAHAAARIDRSTDFAAIVRRHLPAPPALPE